MVLKCTWYKHVDLFILLYLVLLAVVMMVNDKTKHIYVVAKGVTGWWSMILAFECHQFDYIVNTLPILISLM